ncbi:MAG: hypothetical protein JXA67_17665 [Micromonosporaceae bacterium]|nr:hypothetical protein [Micromonosporaceae bacterium]
MAVEVTRDCRVYYNHSVHDLAAGQVVPVGEFAAWLLGTGAPVRPRDEPVASGGTGSPASQPDGDLALVEQVPSGSVADVLTWVDGDLRRAAAALTAEQARGGKPRATLVTALAQLGA